eukprot:4118963-Amphidinium_carterae.1
MKLHAGDHTSVQDAPIFSRDSVETLLRPTSRTLLPFASSLAQGLSSNKHQVMTHRFLNLCLCCQLVVLTIGAAPPGYFPHRFRPRGYPPPSECVHDPMSFKPPGAAVSLHRALRCSCKNLV